MEKGLPKQGWYIEYDESPEFRVLINHLNKEAAIPMTGNKRGWLYGRTGNGTPVAFEKDSLFRKSVTGMKLITLDRFLKSINYNQELSRIRRITSHITFSIFGTTLYLTSDVDKKYGKRIYLQVMYKAPCTKTNLETSWKGGKHYLSEHMTEDEIVKRAYVAFEAAVKHEIMEGFKYDGITVFNPHTDFRKLLEISPYEVRREDYSEPFDF